MKLIITGMGGIIIAGLLFLAMNSLIDVDDAAHLTPPEGEPITFRRVERDESVQTIDRQLPEPEIEREPPPEMPLDQGPTEEPPQTEFDFQTPDLSSSNGFNVSPYQGEQGPRGDGDATPVVRVEPEWPREALVQGTEGWVKLRFTITPEGGVVNARVVESHPRRVFDQAAVRAVQRWRFRPRIVDGRPVEREATQTLVFTLDRED